MHFYILNELIILYTSNQKFVNSLFLLYFVPNKWTEENSLKHKKYYCLKLL